MSKYKVIVDRDTCIGCGLAPATCSEVFVMVGGKNAVAEKYRKEDLGVGVIPEEVYECAKNAAESCPVDAIKIEKIE